MSGDVSTIAFGSCRKQQRPQPIMDAVAALRPDVWVWTGDYLYFKSPRARIDASGEDTVKSRLQHSYVQAGTTEGERRLRSAVPVIDGVYDDHDYGENDAGRRFEHRELARQLFLDSVVKAPTDSPRRRQAGGLYGTRTFGSPPRQVKLIMLDTRFERDDHWLPSPGGSTWLPSPGNVAGALRSACALFGLGSAGDVLGTEEQWSWLEHELANSTASVHLIVSSVQVRTSFLAHLVVHECSMQSLSLNASPTLTPPNLASEPGTHLESAGRVVGPLST